MARSGLYELTVSDAILAELERTLNTPYFRFRLTLEEIAAYLELLRREAAITPITVEVSGVATHPEDDLILATAVSGGVDYLVTGDRQLQRLGSYWGVPILDPHAFLDALDAEPEGVP